MLQQTRVEAVLPYYERFLRRFPTVESLARAPRQEVLVNWAGLGYYRRARMLHDAAKRIVGDFAGQWPTDYRTIRSLPGIGEYTAAAIASIAFDQPRAALDGNGLRVLARFADEGRDVRGAACRRSLKVLAGSLMETVPQGQRGAFTQALIELGATVCVPRAPRCLNCPWKAACAGFASGSAPDLPVKRRHRAATKGRDLDSHCEARQSGAGARATCRRVNHARFLGVANGREALRAVARPMAGRPAGGEEAGWILACDHEHKLRMPGVRGTCQDGSGIRPTAGSRWRTFAGCHWRRSARRPSNS